jgi:hypothetical protein
MAMLFQNDPAAESGPVPSGFNTGAFLFAPLFLLWYRRFGAALLLIAINVVSSFMLRGACVTLLLPLSAFAGVYVGIHANEIAWETQRFQSYAELQRSMFGWKIVGLASLALLTIRVVMG